MSDFAFPAGAAGGGGFGAPGLNVAQFVFANGLSTGALAFVPKLAIFIGQTAFGSGGGAMCVGLATGTGTLAKAVAFGADGEAAANGHLLSTDADAIGGRPAGGGGFGTNSAFVADIDVTAFGQAGITLVGLGSGFLFVLG